MGIAIRGLIACVVLFCGLAGSAQAADATYTYDALGRLIRVDYAMNQAIVYTYDAAGNRTQMAASAYNGPPVAVNDTIGTTQNVAYTFDPRTNDSDPNGYALTITAVSTPGHGTAAINGGTSATYTPASGYYGSDSFTYTVSDGHGGTAMATVTANVTNLPPNAANDNVSTTQNVAVTFDPRSNDSDPYGYGLTIASAGSPSHGSVTVNSGTSITYSPGAGYYGSDSFTYTISDGHGGSATATVSVTVSNNPPVANNDGISTTENVATTFDPRSNDSDPYGYALTITGVSTPGHGTAVVNSGTSVTYTPSNGYYGSESFTYTISDGHGGTASATVSASVAVLPPTANNDSLAVNENGSNSLDPRANDTDPYGYALTISSVSGASHGTVTNNGGTSVTYTPTTNYSGSDSFTYTISDGHGNTATATVSVTVNAGTNPPVAVADSVTANGLYTKGKKLEYSASVQFDPRSNDSDPYGRPLTIISVTQPARGAVVINGGGTSVTYTDTTGSVTNGTTTFTYTISDGQGNTATATVTVTITYSLDCPTC